MLNRTADVIVVSLHPNTDWTWSHARQQAGLGSVVAQIEKAGGRAIAVAGNIRDEALAEALVDTAVESFGGLDVAFNNAGMLGEPGSVVDMPLATWREVLNVNLTSAFLAAKYSGARNARARRRLVDLHVDDHRLHVRDDRFDGLRL